MQKRAADTSGSLCVACSTAGNKEFPFSLQKEMRDFASIPMSARSSRWGEILVFRLFHSRDLACFDCHYLYSIIYAAATTSTPHSL